MKILDRYIAKHFLVGYVIAFAVLIGLRIAIDLFVNLDEYVELTGDDMDSILKVLKHTSYYYAIHTTVYFREFAAIITVVAAAFSLGKLVRSNELIAIMASGVSLKRVVAPLFVMALLLTGLAIANQEILIPHFSTDLARPKDQLRGAAQLPVWLLKDKNNSLIISGNGDVIEPEESVIAIGSGGPFAQAAALALLENTELSAQDIVEKSLKIASDICIYTNNNLTIEKL